MWVSTRNRPGNTARTYTATSAQNGRDVAVTLGGASFFVRDGKGNGFPGTVDPEQVTFLIKDDSDHFDYGTNLEVVELLGGTSVLIAFGRIVADIAPNRLSGLLSGSIIDGNRRVVTRAGEDVPVAPKALECLLALLGRAPHAVSKAELMTLLWPDTQW